MVQIALLLFEGVSGDECEAFTLVLDQVPDADLVTVGAELGPVDGVGHVQEVQATLADLGRPDVVVVPGGLGCQRAARDPDLLQWLGRVAPTSRWVVGSSTGTVLLAAAGLLDDRPAATHWLAGPLLEAYGSSPSPERIVQVGRVITCEGRVTAAEVALILTARLFGPEWAKHARAGLAVQDHRRPTPVPRPRRPAGPPAWWSRVRHGHAPSGPGRPANPELGVSDWVELDAIEMDVSDPP